MSSNVQHQNCKIVTADPTALGLFGLAMVTLVASSQKLGWTTGLPFVLPWVIFLGALAQLIASAHDFKHNNTFGATAFAAYGVFWLGVGMSWMIKLGLFGAEMAKAADAKQLGIAFVGYLIFTAYMTIAAVETNKVLLAIFILIDLLFIGLAMDTFGCGEAWHELAAWSEFFISLLSFYGSAAVILNTQFGRVFFPLGKPLGIFKKH